MKGPLGTPHVRYGISIQVTVYNIGNGGVLGVRVGMRDGAKVRMGFRDSTGVRM